MVIQQTESDLIVTGNSPIPQSEAHNVISGLHNIVNTFAAAHIRPLRLEFTARDEGEAQGDTSMGWLVFLAILAAFFYWAHQAGKKSAVRKARPKPMDNFRLEPVTRSSRTYTSGTIEQSDNSTPAKWISANETVQIHGFTIQAGLFYLGGKFLGQSRYHIENCLIDPTLRVAPSGGNSELPYWPAYAQISPAARRTYLQWLADGRTDPHVDVGYAFLFFYGLERRLFVDKDLTEADRILAEVKRLKGVYSENNSFQRYSDALLEAADILLGRASADPQLTFPARIGYGMPFSLKLYLGKKLAERARLDATDALAWILSSPETYNRTPVTRCFDEFKILWKLRFETKYPNGMKVTPPKTMLRMQYTACSGKFTVDLTPPGDIPDISAVSAPLKPLRQIFFDCVEELDPYSRFIGRKPASKGKPESLLLLPKEVQNAMPNSPMTAISDHLEKAFADANLVVTSTENMAKRFGLETDKAKTAQAILSQLAPALDAMNVGFEPDKRFGSASFPKDGTMVLFRLGADKSVNPDKPEYQAAKAMTEVTSLAAAADGGINDAEYDALRADITGMTGLTAVERDRLTAYAKLLSVDTPRQQGVLNRLAKLSGPEKSRAARSAIAAVLADGHADPAEVRFLEKMYKALGLSADELYSAIHRGAVTIDEPVTIIGEEAIKGIPIPAKPATQALPSCPEGVKIDMARLERIKSETSAVSNLLADIFVEEEDAPPPVQSKLSGDSAFDGLDVPHAKLVALFLTKPELDRGEFEEQARSLRLMPDGAIEAINDWAFDTFDEPLLEGDDTIAVAPHLVDRLKEMEARV